MDNNSLIEVPGVVDLRDIPLSEMAMLGSDELAKAVNRMLPANALIDEKPAKPFQSTI